MKKSTQCDAISPKISQRTTRQQVQNTPFLYIKLAGTSKAQKTLANRSQQTNAKQSLILGGQFWCGVYGRARNFKKLINQHFPENSRAPLRPADFHN